MGGVTSIRSAFAGMLDSARRRLFGPPMIGRPLCEIEFGIWAGSLCCIDASGRPLGENNAARRYARRTPEIEWKAWSQGGSRQGRSYNASAMRQVGECWRGVLADVAVIHRELGCRNFADLSTIARTATAVPAYLYRRRAEPIRDARLDPHLAALFKVMAGVHTLVDHAMLRGSGPRATDVPVATSLIEYIEHEGLFIAPSGHACAGPEPMVRELLTLAIEGRPEIEGERELLSERVGDLQALVRYGQACARLDAWVVFLQTLLSGEPADRPWALLDTLGAITDSDRLVLEPAATQREQRRLAAVSLAPIRTAMQRELAAAHQALERRIEPRGFDTALTRRLGFDPIERLVQLGAVVRAEPAPRPRAADTGELVPR